MAGTQWRRKSSAPTRPPWWVPVLLVPAHGVSWPSSHTSGVTKAKRGVVEAFERSRARWPEADGFPSAARVPSGTTLASQRAWSSMIEWNQTKGSWRVTYWSVGVATTAVFPPRAGWPQSVPPAGSATPPSRAAVSPICSS